MKDSEKDPLGLHNFKIPIGSLASQEVFSTRAGVSLSYRIYPAWTNNLIFLYHGIGSDSRYLCVLAAKLAKENLGTVVTPDLRGHGISLGLSDEFPENQLEQDHEELLIHLRQSHAFDRVFVAGHSLGGGFALRLMSGDLRESFSGALFLAPYLPGSFKVHQEGYGDWTFQDEKKQTHVNMPMSLRSGQEKLLYSEAFMKAAGPREDFLQNLNPHVDKLLSCGKQDQVFQSGSYQTVFAKISNLKIQEIEGADHYSLVMAPGYVSEILLSLKENLNFFV